MLRVPVIVNWFSVDEGHYSVVIKLTRKHIFLRDPEMRGIRKIKRSSFEICWFDFAAEQKPSKKSLIARRMIAVTKSLKSAEGGH